MLRPTLDHIRVRREVQGFQNQRIVIYIPKKTDCPDCGFDEFTQSGEDVACTTCDGTGKATTWYKSHSKARVMWIDPASPRWGIMASGEVGDCWLSVPMSYEDLYTEVEDIDDAYILVDDKKIKPFSIDPNRVEGKSSLDVRCEVVNVQ